MHWFEILLVGVFASCAYPATVPCRASGDCLAGQICVREEAGSGADVCASVCQTDAGSEACPSGGACRARVSECCAANAPVCPADCVTVDVCQ